MIDDDVLLRNEDAELPLEVLRELYQILIDARDDRHHRWKQAEAEASVQNASAMLDEVDAASHDADTDAARRDAERAWMEIQQIDAALARMRQGTYGVCEDTGEPIGEPRLRRIPWARRTMAAESERERL
ncbi:MAG: TraR/DksA family transcriptional regulator [Alphaproteobacteria bacterium]|nr:TraR/DksA family transcriptional regulator [Alphaproteobacteria bacterium]